MKRTSIASTALFAAMLASFQHAPVHAQNNVSYVTKLGSIIGTCLYSQPCTIDRAVEQTNAGGIVYCLDGGIFGGNVVITKALTILCDNTNTAILTESFGIKIAAGPFDVVHIVGLDIIGRPGA